MQSLTTTLFKLFFHPLGSTTFIGKKKLTVSNHLYNIGKISRERNPFYYNSKYPDVMES